LNSIIAYLSSNTLKSKLIKGLAIIVAPLLLWCCDKAKDFNLNTAPPSENFEAKGKYFDLILNTERQSQAATFDAANSLSFAKYFLGYLNEPNTGTLTASIFTELRLSQDNNTIGNKVVLDSVTFVIRLAGTTSRLSGDSLQSQTWNLYPLVSALSADSYFNYSNVSFKTTPIGSYTGNLNRNDSTFRFRIDTSFAKSILNLGSSVLANNTNFLVSFFGLAIIPDTSNMSSTTGAIASLDINNALNVMKIYYHSDLGTGRSLSLNINKDCRKFGRYASNFQGKSLFTDPNYAFNRGPYSLQNKVDISDSLKTLFKNNKLSVNTAEMIFSVNPLGQNYQLPSRLLIFPRVAGGSFETFSTFNGGAGDDNLSLYGGYYNPLDSTYRFKLNLNLQKIADRYRLDPNYNFIGWNLFPTAQNPATARVVSLFKNKSKLRLVYTKLK